MNYDKQEEDSGSSEELSGSSSNNQKHLQASSINGDNNEENVPNSTASGIVKMDIDTNNFGSNSLICTTTDNSIAIGSTPTKTISTAETNIDNRLIETNQTLTDAQQPNGSDSSIKTSMYNQHSRILGRNLNGTIAMTTQPSNESELQLYRVLQRANLLAYYDTFICQGGDDVQQLYEAGEEEFLEIMALVGMAAKPLHVRRLQKALHEWATNPALFQSPLVQPFPANPTVPSTGPNVCHQQSSAITNGPMTGVPPPPPPPPTNGPISGSSNTGTNHRSSNHHQLSSNTTSPRHQNQSPIGLMYGGGIGSTGTAGNQSTTSSPSQFPPTNLGEYSQPCSPSSMTPILMEPQIQRLADAAETLVKSLPPNFIVDLKPPSLINNNNGNKKRIVKEIEAIMTMCDSDPRRMDEIRKYAAIYGRFDCKRKPEKPLTLHEVSVNEAAAQICSKIPLLLYRRDELFPLARQVVRDSGYQYSKGHSRSQSCRIGVDLNIDHHTTTSGENGAKRIRLETSTSSNMTSQTTNNLTIMASPGQESKSSSSDQNNHNNNHSMDRKRRHDRLEGIVDQLKSLGSKQEQIQSQIKDANERQNYQEVSELQNELDMINDHQMQLVNEKSELEQQQQQTAGQTLVDKKSTEELANNHKPSSSTEQNEETGDTDGSQFSLYTNVDEIDDADDVDDDGDQDDEDEVDDDDVSRGQARNQEEQDDNSMINSLINVANMTDNNSHGSSTLTTTINDGNKNNYHQKSSSSGNGKKSSKNSNSNHQTNHSSSNNNGTAPNLSLLSSLTNPNSNDSIDFGKHLNEVIDEGLRLMGHVSNSTLVDDNNLDLRLFNKYTEAVLRNNCQNGNSNNSTEVQDSRTPHFRSKNGGLTGLESTGNNNYPQQQPSHPRQRGRPPKNSSSCSTGVFLERSNDSSSLAANLQNSFYEQLLSQAQIQQQMQQMYQTQLQQSAQAALYAQALFGAAGAVTDFGTTGTTTTTTTTGNELTDLQSVKQVEQPSTTGPGYLSGMGSDAMAKSPSSSSADEIVQSLNALISMSNNVVQQRRSPSSGNMNNTTTTSIPTATTNSAEFKIV